MSRPLHLVDVFARQRYAGNQLAVVADAGGLSTEEMQAVAAEMDYSETTFVTGPPEDGAWPVRIFTPVEEIPFAGHPTLGTAHVIRTHLADGRPDDVVLDLGVGEVPVEVRTVDGDETLWMTQQPPEFGEELPHADLAEVLGLPEDAVDPDWPVQVVSTGLPTVVVPLVDRAAVTGIDLDPAAYDRVTGDRAAKNVLAFCPDPREDANDLADRVFAPFYDVPEDPATGSSNGCLAAYLARHEYFGDATVEARVEQGHEMGRPSLLHLRADAGGDAVDVEVGGNVVPVARGELL
ncbi:PhzF family phenazine biosynthesis protein [Haloarcula litorea]|uniref:PhzF family phenazine biosynthesis protein n=1 Tax=Haloarcula litorea TaxID=3032579 RepID=UPI0023E8C7D2|nr:PhzF family phenazine biosynthesis protein [Halomicroarcula sp. GDY20]